MKRMDWIGGLGLCVCLSAQKERERFERDFLLRVYGFWLLDGEVWGFEF